MSNYWVDLIERQKRIKELQEEQHRRDAEEIYRQIQNANKLRAIFDSQRKQKQ